MPMNQVTFCAKCGQPLMWRDSRWQHVMPQPPPHLPVYSRAYAS